MLVRGDRCEVAAISASTISRELARNRIHGVYSAQVEQMRTEQRRRERPLVRKMDRPEIRDAVQDGLIQSWSPDQISGRQRQQFAEQPQRHVSASTVYRWIQQQGAQRKHWQQLLRRRGRRPYRPRKPANRPAQPIRDRPRIIERRQRLGDFEGDLVLGRTGTGGVLTLVDRRSRFLGMEKVRDKTARHVHAQFRKPLTKLPATQRHSTTFDNGSEFARGHLVENTHGTRLYFAEPGCPHQRGTNQHGSKKGTNGLIRQFFPKGTDFRTVTPSELRRVEHLLNHRPRRCLGYRTPAEVFLEESSRSNCD